MYPCLTFISCVLVEVSDGRPSTSSRIVISTNLIFRQIDVSESNVLVFSEAADSTVPCWRLLASSPSSRGSYPTDEHGFSSIYSFFDFSVEIRSCKLLTEGKMIFRVDCNNLLLHYLKQKQKQKSLQHGLTRQRQSYAVEVKGHQLDTSVVFLFSHHNYYYTILLPYCVALTYNNNRNSLIKKIFRSKK